MKTIQRLKSKKGFSLVELLIVIAIMAVLVGVLAPQYFRYLERSRQSSDIQVLNSIANAIQTIGADPMFSDAMPAGGTTIVINWAANSNGAITIEGAAGNTNLTDIQNELISIIGSPVTARSNLARAAVQPVHAEVQMAGGIRITRAGAGTSTNRTDMAHAARNILTGTPSA